MKNPYSVAEVGAELLNDKSEAARDLLEHGVGEGPVLLRRDLLRDSRRRHLQLHHRVDLLRVLHYGPQ